MTAAADTWRALIVCGMLAAALLAGWAALWAATPGLDPAAYTLDRATGEVWACPQGACQTNE